MAHLFFTAFAQYSKECLEGTGNAMSVPVVGAVICSVLATISNGPAIAREPEPMDAFTLRAAFPD